MKSSPHAFSFAVAAATLLAPAATLVFLVSPASAETPKARHGVEVRVERTAPGGEAMRAQIAAAAYRVCDAVSTHSPTTPWEDGKCRRDAERRALSQVAATAPLADQPLQMASRD